MLNNAIEIGRRLKEDKDLIPYGEWSKWLAEARYSEYQRHHFHILNRIMTIKKKPAELLKSSGFLPFLIRPRLKHRGYSILCYGRPGCYIVKKNKMNAKAPAVSTKQRGTSLY